MEAAASIRKGSSFGERLVGRDQEKRGTETAAHRARNAEREERSHGASVPCGQELLPIGAHAR
jgi:hypothetical protein